jgi:hypothetical protein
MPRVVLEVVLRTKNILIINWMKDLAIRRASLAVLIISGLEIKALEL